MLNPLDHPICFAFPRRLTPLSAWHEHIPFAMLLVNILRPAVIVELGTQSGDSYCAFCQAVNELKLDTRCYAVDSWRGDSHTGYYDTSIIDDLRAHHDPLYGSFSRLIESSFDDALKHFADGSIDLLHIDGYHTYEAVRHDFESWLAKMSDRGVMLFHDTNVRERDFGVSIFWDEVKQKYPYFEFLHGHGLGVLSVGNARSVEFQALLELKVEEAIKFREFFFQLGHRVTLRSEVEKMERALKDKENVSEDHQARLTELEKTGLIAEKVGSGKTNTLQLFWREGEEFSEEHSLEETIAADGNPHGYCFRLPPSARGPLRLDPGNRPAYARINHLALYAIDADSNQQSDLIASWSADNDFAGIFPSSSVVRLGGNATYSFICFGADPQLLLSGVPDREDERPWSLQLWLSVTEEVQEIILAEIARMKAELASRETRLTAATRSLAAQIEAKERDAQAHQSQIAGLMLEQERLVEQVAEKEGEIQTLVARATESARIVEDLRAGFYDEREQLTRQIDEKEKELESLAAEAASKKVYAESLLLEMADQKNLRDQVEAERERLANQAREDARAIESLSTELARKERELQRITRSLGWRLLSRYGRIKYRFLLPAYRRVLEYIELLLKREYHPSVEPINDIRLSGRDGVWQSAGNDPQFNVKGRWPKGRAEVLIDIEPEGPVKGHARLYVDRGAGYSEADSYDLGEAGGPRRVHAVLGPEVIALRLDPFESPGNFRINKLAFEKGERSLAGKRQRLQKERARRFGLEAIHAVLYRTRSKLQQEKRPPAPFERIAFRRAKNGAGLE